MRGVTAIAAAVLAVVFTIPVHAADPNAWTVSIGAEAGGAPRYEGANSYVFRPLPLIDIRRAGVNRGGGRGVLFLTP